VSCGRPAWTSAFPAGAGESSPTQAQSRSAHRPDLLCGPGPGRHSRGPDRVGAGLRRPRPPRRSAGWRCPRGPTSPRSVSAAGPGRNRLGCCPAVSATGSTSRSPGKHGGGPLLLDEPANDLDVETLSALENALLGFPGRAVITAHDRWILDRLATHIRAWEGHQRRTGALAVVRGQRRLLRHQQAQAGRGRGGSGPRRVGPMWPPTARSPAAKTSGVTTRGIVAAVGDRGRQVADGPIARRPDRLRQSAVAMRLAPTATR